MPAPALLQILPLVDQSLTNRGYDLALRPLDCNKPVGRAAISFPQCASSIARPGKGRFCAFDWSLLHGRSAAPGTLVLSARREATPERMDAELLASRLQGYRICLDIQRLRDWSIDLLGQADMLRFMPEQAHFAQRTHQFPARRVLNGVHSKERYEKGRESGFHLFQGGFITDATQRGRRPAQALYENIVRLIRAAAADAPLDVLDDLLKRDPALSYRLLRYINTAGFGLSCEITSLKHAVTVLGYGNLRKWLALLLVTAARSNSSPALATAAVRRGRLAELVGTSISPDLDADELFIAGAFSLLHLIMAEPLPAIAEQLVLPVCVTDALLRGGGPYAPILRLVTLSEQFYDESALQEAARLCESLTLAPTRLNDCAIQAVAFSEGIED